RPICAESSVPHCGRSFPGSISRACFPAIEGRCSEISRACRLAPVRTLLTIAGGLVVFLLLGAPSEAQQRVLTGQGALGDWTTDAPGVRRRITVADLPKPFATEAAQNDARIVKRPDGAWPRVPSGFQVEEFANGLDNPRLIRLAPNGDLFLAESSPGRIR